MALPFYNWSRTASSNATADSTVNWAEGQSPSSVNDSARAMMASTAAFRDDIAGAIVTAGVSTAYTVTSYEIFDTLAHLDGRMIAFTPHTTNGATVTLNVDGLGAKPLRAQPSVDLQSGVLIQGTPYAALYNNSDAVFYLFGVGTSPGIPLGSSIDYWASSAPTSSFALAYGQAVSRTTYASLFSLFSTTYGSGDGTTTFNLPDLRGRVIAGADAMGGSAASRLTSTYFGAAAALGATGGTESETLTLAQLPTGITSTNAAQAITVTPAGGSAQVPTTTTNWAGTTTQSTSSTGIAFTAGSVGSTNSFSGSNSISVTSNNTSGNAHTIVQPTICANKLLRII